VSLRLDARDKRIAAALKGRRITRVALRPWDPSRYRGVDGARDGYNTSPALTLDDGSVLTFSAQESEGGEYGVALVLAPPKKKSKARGGS